MRFMRCAATQEEVQNRMISLILAALLPAQLGAAMPADSVNRLRGQARSAEAYFERLSRNLAPVAWGGFDGRNCDEIVGRFCLRFDSTGTPRPSPLEAGRVVDARRAAVEAQRRYFAAAPHERTAAGPLVRLLVQDDRASEAVAVAGTFAALSGDSLWSSLFQGLALHAAGDADAAERHFAAALRHMDPATRATWADPRWLVDWSEQRELRRMGAAQRADYERRFWIASDPFWLTGANERWVEHMARHAEARLLAEVPVVQGMTRWGRDLDELTVRYGTPSARSRVPGTLPMDPGTFVEYFDTAQRAYTPERMATAGFPEPPLPGDPPPLYAARTRSGYAMRAFSRVTDLPHQATRFLAGDDVVLRIDGALPAPSDSARGTLELGLFVYDSAFTRRLQQRSTPDWQDDTTSFSLAVRSPAGVLIYSAEALDTVAGVAARARYRLPALVPDAGPVVSDLLLCRPFRDGGLPERNDDPSLRPLPSLVLTAGDTLGLYAEVYRLAGRGAEALAVELSLEPLDGPGLLSRIGRWIGRAAGLAGPRTDPRVSWRAEAGGDVYPVAMNLPIDVRRSGRYVLILRATDLVTGQASEARRPVLIRPGR
jgi:hypothetical protein